MTHFIQGKKVFSLLCLYWFDVTFIAIESVFSRGMLSCKIKTYIFFILFIISFPRRARFLTLILGSNYIFVSEKEDVIAAGFFLIDTSV